MGRGRPWFLFLILNLFLIISVFTAAQPLSTNSRWIVDESGHRVKLACVNWPSHLEVAVAEGLSKRPVDEISKEIIEMGFNCVRLTWPLFLFTNDSLASLSVRQSFKNYGLIEAISGLQANNPSIVDLSLINAYQAVVASLTNNNVMIVLDNHLSKPGWCCSNNDGNGFFGDQYFSPQEWIKGLTKVATTFKNTKNVVAMSLRNELRGPRQNTNVWYRYMQQGAEVVHEANPNLLVIISGLKFDRDLSFLTKNPLTLSFSNKTVFELHWYGFSDGSSWETGNPNHVCGRIVNDVKKNGGFLLDQGYPLFLSEWGVDLRGTNVNDNRFLNCFMGWAAEFDVDWALWTLTGSYYLREGVVGLNEYYGVYNWNWNEIRNQSFLDRISSLQYPFRGPGYIEIRWPHKVIYHPLTGLCVKRKSFLEQLTLGPCCEAEAWAYSSQEILTIKGTYFCLQACDLGKPAKLGIICSGPNSKWEAISDSKMHLSSKLEDGRSICLDVDSENNIVTNNCKCLSKDSSCDPASQWFKIIESTRSTLDKNLFFEMNSVFKIVTKNLFSSLGMLSV